MPLRDKTSFRARSGERSGRRAFNFLANLTHNYFKTPKRTPVIINRCPIVGSLWKLLGSGTVLSAKSGFVLLRWNVRISKQLIFGPMLGHCCYGKVGISYCWSMWSSLIIHNRGNNFVLPEKCLVRNYRRLYRYLSLFWPNFYL